jgi:hypothetical protein
MFGCPQELDDSMQRKAAAAAAAETADSNAQPDQQQAELQQLQASIEACISGLSEVLNTALQRLRRLGLEGFAGAGEEASVLQLVEWLSTSSYNAGVIASRESCRSTASSSTSQQERLGQLKLMFPQPLLQGFKVVLGCCAYHKVAWGFFARTLSSCCNMCIHGCNPSSLREVALEKCLFPCMLPIQLNTAQ